MRARHTGGRVRTRRLIAGAGALAAILALPCAALAQPFDTRPRETAALKRAKTRADSVLPPASRRPAAPRTQLFNNTVLFAGVQALDNEAWAGYTPPDSTGAAGVDRYVEIVNSRIAVFNKDGTVAVPSDDLQHFYKANGLTALATGTSHGDPGDSVFDVQVQWDEASQRWLIASADEEASGTAPNHVIFGWSATPDPAGAWCVWRTSGTHTFDDYPKLGHDDTHLMIGTNEFVNNSEASGFNQSNLWVVQTPPASDSTCPASQPSIVGGGPQEVRSAFTPVPVNIADSGTTGYVVATTGAAASSLVLLYTVDATGHISATGAPITVKSFSEPPSVQQPGSTDVIDSSDGRLTQAAAVGGRIWTQHTVRSADGQRAEVRWYEIDPAATNKLVQEGAITDLSNSVFNAAVSPAVDGTHAAIQFNVGGAFHLVEIRGQMRAATTPLGQMENELTVDTSAAIDQDFSCAQGPSCRWGDYSGASPDPATGNEAIVWGTNQLNGLPPGPPGQPGDPAWVTRNFALQFGDNNQPFTASVDGFPFTSPSAAPAFNFAASRTGSTFQCSLNGGAFAPCTPGRPFGPALANGSYTFAVIATDPAGQQSAPVQGSFIIAAPLPETVIDSGPPASGTSRTASFVFHSSKAGSSFRCSFDGSAFAACASPFIKTHLSPRTHAFAVRAIDAQGNVEPTPAASSFKVSLAQGTATVRPQRISRRHTVSVRVSCPARREQRCTGTITLTSRIKLASKRFRVSAGRRSTVHVTVTKTGRRRLQSKKRLKVKASARFNTPTKRITRTFILRKR
jgi:hypothetical protein